MGLRSEEKVLTPGFYPLLYSIDDASGSYCLFIIYVSCAYEVVSSCQGLAI